MLYIHFKVLSSPFYFVIGISKIFLDEIGLTGWCQATMPHSTIGINWFWICNYLRNWQISIVSVDYAYSDSAVSSKCTMNLFLYDQNHNKIQKLFIEKSMRGVTWRCVCVKWLTAFCPRTVQRIPSEALARTARIMYVGSMYFTSIGILTSLKYFFVYTKKKDEDTL